MPSVNLDNAKKNKKDEFYTQMDDIVRELNNYESFFEGKVVYCNCDDPFESNFVKYFAMCFNSLKLKKLIATSYLNSKIANKEISLFNTEAYGYVLEIEEMKDYNGDGAIDIDDFKYYLEHINPPKELKGTGDFRSGECIEFLKEADVVVTNPPFSLFRDYVAQLIEYDKKFLIVGHENAITYKEIFALIKANKIWLGYGFKSAVGYFYSCYEDYATAGQHKENMIRVSGVTWFTNIPHNKRNSQIHLYKQYIPEDYPFFENYPAINVDRTTDIPCDYDGEIGVPITFLSKYCPSQFDIVALGIVGSITFTKNRRMEILNKKTGERTGKFTTNAKGTLYRLQKDTDKEGPAFIDCETGELYHSIFARIIIKKK